ncbi:ACT domain-containing protein ACR1 isoform X4 [Medicago truncatula]|uniref:ACT domain-containing protein ACR n=3 Tax=Medicago truncatula TaxID=3880 RepID=G7JF79_MEDTR|nr:ACT domain-containing protein ACR1 isoform X4 [Medicago truncatula]XP_024637400.1 ACT domain-containing protein ACR1 isoform X4 [Medicago truncatula]XP_039689645.1 ACT domain-containing protein ACR1 isoform X4 [Medicago truncatula]XP_039689646.1 ACT domain-containing protein ACR1 isoform X4 [Medicago truncatula]AES90748.2 four ACT domain ACT domain protein which protein [Medicago truncatula]
MHAYQPTKLKLNHCFVEDMEIVYQQPHIDREIESLKERIHPPRVCIDNDSCRNCTVVKIDRANKHGILLEMVQALTDLDLIISKSYISSDGGWLMDVFHVKDQIGNKLTDKSLVNHIEQILCECTAKSNGETSSETVQHCCKGPQEANVAIEVIGTDRPGLFSEISVVLMDLGFNIISAKAWTHNDKVVCIIYPEDASRPGPINERERLAQVVDQIRNVIEANEGKGDKDMRSVVLKSSTTGHSHTERRLHQMMYAASDYESCHACHGDNDSEHKRQYDGTHVSVDRYQGRDYWVVNVRSRDRPKLLFDIVCMLTDMQYEVFHAAVTSNSPMAEQEYFIRNQGSSNLDNETEKQRLTLCLIAAIECRASHGLKVDIRTQNKMGLLSKVTQVIHENGLSITRIEFGVEGEAAIGSLYVTGCSGQDVNENIVELIKREIGGSIVLAQSSPYRDSQSSSSSNNSRDVIPTFSFGGMIRSHLERLINNFRPIRS